MMRSVKQATRDADALLVIVDAADRPAQTLTFLQSVFDNASVPTAVVLNKARALPSCMLLHAVQAHCQSASTDAGAIALHGSSTRYKLCIQCWQMCRPKLVGRQGEWEGFKENDVCTLFCRSTRC